MPTFRTPSALRSRQGPTRFKVSQQPRARGDSNPHDIHRPVTLRHHLQPVETAEKSGASASIRTMLGPQRRVRASGLEALPFGRRPQGPVCKTSQCPGGQCRRIRQVTIPRCRQILLSFRSSKPLAANLQNAPCIEESARTDKVQGVPTTTSSW